MGFVKKILNTVPRPWLIRASYVVRPILAFFYRGKRYTDPIDGRSFRKFLPYGYATQRPNVLSPSTLSLERHRLLWLYLQRRTVFFGQEKLSVLHVAPEQAFYRRFRKQPNLQYVTTDLFSPLADIKADICQLPLPDNSFDVVFCNHVLEHIPDDKKAMQEIFRVLKKGGWAVLQVPQDWQRNQTFSDPSITDPKERTRIFGQYDHVRIYGRDYFQILESQGFEVQPIACTDLASTQEIDTFRLDAHEILPVCYKH